MSSSAPPSPRLNSSSSSRSHSLSPEERRILELELLMQSPEGPNCTGLEDGLDAGDVPPPSDNDELPQLRATPTPEWNTSSLRVESDRAKRQAIARKLHPYQRDLVNDFLRLPQISRGVFLYINQFEILNKLEDIVTTSRTFVVSEPLKENIKAYVDAVLLSSKLSSYHGSIPRDHVMNILNREGLNLPENYERDSSIVRTISKAVADQLTQTRAAYKKEFAASIEKKWTIYELAIKLTHHTRCIVTPAFCARLALLRQVLVEDPTPTTYWTSVDKRLKLIRATAKDNPIKITRAFSAFLTTDRSLYGGADSDIPVIAPSAATWQESVDGIMDN